jgi:hypothetical protein
MKCLILSALFSFTAMASEVSFKCDFTDHTYINQFSLKARNVRIDDGKFSNVEFDFTIRKAGRDAREERLVVTRSGTANDFPPEAELPYQAMRLASAIKGAEVESINLLIDVPPMYTSEIRFKDDMAYRGTCKRL